MVKKIFGKGMMKKTKKGFFLTTSTKTGFKGRFIPKKNKR